jgi:hypothetical protein
METKRLEIILRDLLKEYPTGIFLEWYGTGDLVLCIDHYKYIDPREAPKLWLGKFLKPKLHESKRNCFYITKI